MSTPFLLGYARALVHHLLTEESIEVAEGRVDEVVAFVADFMLEHGQNQSAIALTGRALMACPDVEELYLDDAGLKDAVDSLAH